MNHGKGGDHIQLSPPLTISEAEIDELLAALDAALTALEDTRSAA
jgi:4-aminobutyrate aminotransferase-like enzyme